MKRVFALLDAARDVCGSDAALARRIGVDPSHPAQWRAGKRKLNAEMVGLLADVVGLPTEDATRLALLAVIEGAKDPGRQGVLRRVFFALSALSAATVSAGPVVSPKAIPPTPRAIEKRTCCKKHSKDDLTKRELVPDDEEQKTHWRGVKALTERAALFLRDALDVICPRRSAC